MEKNILTVTGVVERSKREGMGLTEHTVRQAIRTGVLPCRIVGRKYLIAWSNVEKWLMCKDGQDNDPIEEKPASYGTIRPQGV